MRCCYFGLLCFCGVSGWVGVCFDCVCGCGFGVRCLLVVLNLCLFGWIAGLIVFGLVTMVVCGLYIWCLAGLVGLLF